MINLSFSEATLHNKAVPEMPFPECGAMSQGYIGFHLQNALQNELMTCGLKKMPATIVTQVEVDPNDPAFPNIRPNRLVRFTTKRRRIVSTSKKAMTWSKTPGVDTAASSPAPTPSASSKSNLSARSSRPDIR
ncbi:MAG: hypothetical protein MZU97_03525 [Bacillus subtilis]|nr:hypothetical protein [Bacillus subtilis]